MFGINIKELRKKKGLTQEKLASVIGVERSTVGKWESKNIIPSSEMLQYLADYFDVSIDELLTTIGEQNNTSPKKGIKIPVLGRVQAGIPIEAIEEIIDYEEIPRDMAYQGEYFALQIKGDSMEPRMKEGDVIIVRKQSDCESGDTAIVLINGDDATCKRIKKTSEGIILMSTNPKYEPMFFSNTEIQKLPITIIGRVVELRAKF